MPGPVFLRGDRVTLRPQESDDAPLVQRLLNDPVVRAGIGHSTPVTRGEFEAWTEAEAEDDHHFVVCVDDDPVGTCVLHEDQHPWGYGEVGYSILPEHWGNGYATDAVDCLARYAFQERRCQKLGADAYATNPGSCRVLEKVGFRQEGRRRDHAFVDGDYVDLVEFGLLASEWRG